MQRAELEHFHNDPDWRSAYETALATAATTGLPENHADVLEFAFQTATRLTDARADAEVQRETDLAATRQRIAEYEARQAAPTAAQPDPAQDAAARAVAAINARRSSTAPQTSTPAQTPGAAEAAGAPTGQEGENPWAAAIAAVNRGR